MNKKLLIFISICILFFVGGCPLPFNVAICGNDICETGEETVCPGDCPGITDTLLSDTTLPDTTGSTTDTTSTTTSQTYSDVTNTTTSIDVTNTTTSSNVTNTTNATTTSSTTQTSSEEDDDDDDHRHYSRSSTTTTTSTTSIDCTHKWQCTGWNPCEENGMQTRICYYVGNCTTEGNQSDTRQRCTYVAPEQEEYIPEEEQVYPTCYDGIKNQGEKGIDCDGPCPACEVPQVQEPQSNTLYVVLAIGLLLLIIAALGYIFRNKWMPYWEKIKSTFVKPKPQPMQFRQFPQRPQYQQPQQYRRY